MDATGTDTPLEAAAALIGAGARIVVCSLGSEGLLAVERDDQAHGPPRAWRAQLPEPLSGNPTGAGDALVAALASRLLAAQASLPDVLARAVAVSASAVTRPVAGEVDLEIAAQLETTVRSEERRVGKECRSRSAAEGRSGRDRLSDTSTNRTRCRPTI